MLNETVKQSWELQLKNNNCLFARLKQLFIQFVYFFSVVQSDVFILCIYRCQEKWVGIIRPSAKLTKKNFKHLYYHEYCYPLIYINQEISIQFLWLIIVTSVSNCDTLMIQHCYKKYTKWFNGLSKCTTLRLNCI